MFVDGEMSDSAGYRNSIGVLDIFGFEILELNSFEQLCINLANEKLQAHFNGFVFQEELKLYKKEGLDVTDITFADNQPCLNMLEKKPRGVFPMVDEECVVPKGSDDSLLNKLMDTHRKNEFWGKPPKGSRTCFVINHFAGGVAYDVTNFLEKNRDVLQHDLQAFMSESEDELIKKMFPPPQPQRGRQPTLGGQFKVSLQELYDKLQSTAPFFIKCVKSNQIKQGGVFDSKYTLTQITYLGLLEVVNIRQQGFPVRRTPEVFLPRYLLLADGQIETKRLNLKAPHSAVFKKALQELMDMRGIAGQWQIGKKHVFMKDSMYQHFESQRGLRIEASIRVLQGFMRDCAAKAQWKGLTECFVEFQARTRGVIGRELAEERRRLIQLESDMRDAIRGRDKDGIQEALQKSDRIEGLDQELHDEAVALWRHIDEEDTIREMLAKALASKFENDLQSAIGEAKSIPEDELQKDTLLMLNQAKTMVAAMIEKRNANMKKEEQLEEVKKEINAALMSTEEREDKRIALMVAVQHAESIEHNDAKVKEAREMLEKLIVDIDMEKALKSAIEMRNKSMLIDSIKSSEDAGGRAWSLGEAKLVLEEIEEEETAEKELAMTLKTGNEDKIADAAKKAEAAGVKVEKSEVLKDAEQGKAKRKAKKRKKGKGKREYIEEMQGLSYVERMQELQAEFTDLKSFEGLRSKEMSLNYTKIPIKRPMLKYTEDGINADRLELERKATAMFQSILGYMGDRKMQFPEMLASEVLSEGLENPELVDEIYIQVMKQCTRNTTRSLRRGWQMLGFCCRTFPPSQDLLPYVDVFIFNGCVGDHLSKDDRDKIVAFAQSAVRKLEQRVAEGPVENAMTKDEIEAIRAENSLMAQVYFADHSVKAFKIDEDVTVENLKDMVSVELGIAKIDTYGILDVSNVSEPRTLPPHRKVLDVMEAWQRPAENRNEEMIAIEEKHNALLKKKKEHMKVVAKAEKKLEEAKVNQKENKDKKKKKELKKLTTEAEEELKKLSKTTKKVQKECMESLKHVRAVAKRKPKKGLLRTLTAAKPKVGVHKLMFKKRLWTEIVELPKDPVELHLMYSEAVGFVSHGKFNASDTEALLLAALSIQIEYGDHNPDRHTAGFLKNIIQVRTARILPWRQRIS